jgi:uncharacterized protein YqeY
MGLEDRIMKDLKEAMKSKDQAAMRGIRAIKAAILLQKTDGSGQALNDELEVKLLQKLVKQRRDSLEIYEKQGRIDLASVEREEIEVIERYLPKQLSEKELETVLAEIISRTGASSMQEMGKVMGIATKELSGKADGRAISVMVKKLLEC